jgi:hypothetical protein
VKWSKQTLQIVSELLSVADLCSECPKVRQVVAARVESLLAGNEHARQAWEVSPKVIQEILAEMKRPTV